MAHVAVAYAKALNFDLARKPRHGSAAAVVEDEDLGHGIACEVACAEVSHEAIATERAAAGMLQEFTPGLVRG